MCNAGQIVRITLENFMTYDNIDIYPGNYLNLIIGPNGTGKSSIVCAVVLVLGGKLKTLGRADQFGSYVKTGCDQCSIEIELYQPEGENVVIKRKISQNNQSQFFINGKNSTVTKVNEIRRNFNIHIDNLCTFLPQERVQDFAKLNPRQLLDQTQRTVGDSRLVQLHEELKSLQSRIADQEKQNLSLQNELENLKQKNDRLEDKIKSFKERQSLSDKITALNQKKAWLVYDEEVKNKDEIGKDHQLAEKVYNSKKKEAERLVTALQNLEKELSTHQNRLTEAKADEAGKKQALEERLRRMERRTDNLEDIESFVKLKLDEEEEKKKEMLKYKETVEKLTNDLKTVVETEGPESELVAKKEEADRRLKAIRDEEIQLTKAAIDLEEDEDTLNQELRNTNREFEHLERQKNARLEFIKSREPDVHKSMAWLERNKDLFQSRVYNPMLLELDVPNPKMAKYVEAVVSYRDLISFTCTNPDDLNLLIRKLRTEQGLKVNAICSDDYETSQTPTEIPMHDLRSLGFHSYLKDLMVGPEPILRFLCVTYGVHRIPVGDEKVGLNCDRVPQKISTFCSESDIFSVKYSTYSGEKSISVKKIDQPKYFAESRNEGRIQVLLQKKKELTEKIRGKNEEKNRVNDRKEALRKSLEEVKAVKRHLSTTLEERQQIQWKLERAVGQYKAVRGTLRETAEIEKEAETQRETLIREIQKNLEELKMASEALKKSRIVVQTRTLTYSANKFEKNRISESKLRCQEELSQKEKLLREMKERLRTAEHRCADLKESAKRLTKNVSRGERGFREFEETFAQLPDTVDEIEAEIVDAQTKCEFLHGGSLQVLQDYEKREKTIAQLTEVLDSGARSLQGKRDELSSKQDQWLNPVNELVSNINEKFGRFFEAMGCAGEVSLVSGENKSDFDQYGIKILVKFREETPLQELGRFFQSGGERAVATAVFMLSLQELTSVPFRFVDEINQGMDRENERRILQLIIRVTASEESRQYFFITPKLLPDLECSRTMTVLCIYNGRHAIPAAEWDLRKFLGRKSRSDGEDLVTEEEPS